MRNPLLIRKLSCFNTFMCSINRKLLIALSLVSVMTNGCVTKPESEKISIHVRGKVTLDTIDGTSIDSVYVTMYEDWDNSGYIQRQMSVRTYTNSDGFYEMQGKCPKLSDNYYLTVHASKSGYDIATKQGKLREGVQILNFIFHRINLDGMRHTP